MMSTPSSTIYLQSALRSLEDRYQKLQLRTDALHNENERLVTSRSELMVEVGRLVTSRSELMAEVERLRDQQIRLRERNLKLTQEYHSKQKECSLLAENLTLFARGRVGSSQLRKSDLKEVREDIEGSFESLETIELQGVSVSRPKVLNVAKRALSEPNLSVIQHELEMVRKGLWSPARENGKDAGAGELSSQIIFSLKKSQSELEEQYSRMVEIQQSMEEVEKISNISGILEDNVYIEDAEPLYNLQKSTQTAVELRNKLQDQNHLLKKLHNALKARQGLHDTTSASVVTQTSLNSYINESIGSSVWRNMQTDRICPLCETVFSTVISQEEFEDHVMDHFNGVNGFELPDFKMLEP